MTNLPNVASPTEAERTGAFSIQALSLSLLNVCAGCQGTCCVGRTMVVADERNAIVAYTGKDHFIHWKDDLYYLDRGSCPYLKNGLCSVQEIKPFVCQIFPFVPRVVDGEWWLYCVGECDAGTKLPAGFIEKAKALARDFFVDRRTDDYSAYWNQNKTGDFDERLTVLKIRVYDKERKENSQG